MIWNFTYQESELNWALCRVVLRIQSTSSNHTNRNILMILTSSDIYSNLFLLSMNICTLYSIFLSSHSFCSIFSIMPVVCYHSYVLFYFMSLMTNSFCSISFFFMTLALQNFPGQISKSQNLNDPFVCLHEAHPGVLSSLLTAHHCFTQPWQETGKESYCRKHSSVRLPIPQAMVRGCCMLFSHFEITNPWR